MAMCMPSGSFMGYPGFGEYESMYHKWLDGEYEVIDTPHKSIRNAKPLYPTYGSIEEALKEYTKIQNN